MDKMFPFTTQVNPTLLGQGPTSLVMKCHFKRDYGQDQSRLDWTYNVRASKENPIERLEFEKEETCGVSLDSQSLPEGSVAGIFKTYIVSEEEMRVREPLSLMRTRPSFCLGLEMKGQGQITIGGSTNV